MGKQITFEQRMVEFIASATAEQVKTAQNYFNALAEQKYSVTGNKTTTPAKRAARASKTTEIPVSGGVTLSSAA